MSRTRRAYAVGLGAGHTEPVDVGATLERLKKKLCRATDFLEPWSQFHDEVAMAPAFMDLGKRDTSERLDLALVSASAKVMGKQYPLTDSAFTHIEEHGFWHGVTRCGPLEVIFFYFDGVDVGLMGLFRNIAENHLGLVRFSLVDLPAGVLGLSRVRGQA